MGGYGNLKSLELGGYTKTRYDCIITLPILSLLPPRVCSIVPCGYRRGGDGVRRVHGRDALARFCAVRPPLCLRGLLWCADGYRTTALPCLPRSCNGDDAYTSLKREERERRVVNALA